MKYFNIAFPSEDGRYPKILRTADFSSKGGSASGGGYEVATAPPLTFQVNIVAFATSRFEICNSRHESDFRRGLLAQVMVVRISGKHASIGERVNDRPASHSYTFFAWLRPSLMTMAAPNLPAASLAALLPEIITMDGVIDRRGLVLRSDARPWRSAPRKSFSLVRALMPGVIQIFDFPIHALVEQIEIPAMSGFAMIIPETIDTAIDATLEDITVRFQPLPFAATAHAALRVLLARIWPSIEQQTLDGERAEVAVAIPRDINISSMSAGWWEGRHAQREESIFRAWQQGNEIIATTARSFGYAFFETKPNILISSRCDTGLTNQVFVLGPLSHPQLGGFIWSVALDLAVGNMVFCVSPTEQIIIKTSSLRENAFVDSLFNIPERLTIPK